MIISLAFPIALSSRHSTTSQNSEYRLLPVHCPLSTVHLMRECTARERFRCLNRIESDRSGSMIGAGSSFYACALVLLIIIKWRRVLAVDSEGVYLNASAHDLSSVMSLRLFKTQHSMGGVGEVRSVSRRMAVVEIWCAPFRLIPLTCSWYLVCLALS